MNKIAEHKNYFLEDLGQPHRVYTGFDRIFHLSNNRGNSHVTLLHRREPKEKETIFVEYKGNPAKYAIKWAVKHVEGLEL